MKRKLTDGARLARRKLRVLMVLFGLALAVPFVLFVFWTLIRLEDESFLAMRIEAAEVVTQIDERIGELLTPEEKRGFDEYGFFSVTQNSGVQMKGVRYSPLSEIPPKNGLPGTLGYFQINPDNSFQTPYLPTGGDLSTLGFSPAELAKRKALVDTIHRSVSALKSAPASGIKDSQKHEELQLHDNMDMSSDNEKREKQKGASNKLSSIELDDALLSRNIVQKPTAEAKAASASLGGAFDKFRSSRKEELSVASQALETSTSVGQTQKVLGGFFNEQRAIEAAPAVAPPAESAPALSTLAKTIVTFEGEIDPLQLVVGNDSSLLFFRRVWRAQAKYLQGFIVDKERFFKETLDPTIQKSSVAQWGVVRLAYKGEILRQQGYSPRVKEKENLVLRRTLSAPLEGFELIISAGHIPRTSGESLVAAFSLVIGIILLLGLTVLYKLSLGHLFLSEQKGDFVAAVSHELKTPLTSIRMYAEILRAGWVIDEEKRTGYLGFILTESERLSRLIENVLSLARMERGAMQITLVKRTTHEILSLVQDKVRAQVVAAGFTLTVIEEEGEKVVEVDEDGIVRVFLNLIDNALKFSRSSDRKELHIGSRRGKGREEIEFFVRDFGPGISKSEKRKIFELFYRCESELTRDTPGTGIGLSLVKSIVTKMGGKVDVTNKDPGAEFLISLKETSTP